MSAKLAQTSLKRVEYLLEKFSVQELQELQQILKKKIKSSLYTQPKKSYHQKNLNGTKYWYASWRGIEGTMQTEYIGKQLPEEIKKEIEQRKNIIIKD